MEETTQAPPFNPRWLVLGLAIMLGVFAVAHGLFFFPDEYRYFTPLTVWDSLQQGNQARAEGLLGTMADRPLYYLFYAPVSFLQMAASGGVYAPDPHSGWVILYEALWVPQAVQVLLLVLNTWLVMRVADRLFASPRAGLFSGFLYVFWPANLFFTRHVMPPLLAETFLLLSIVCLARGLRERAGGLGLAPLFLAGMCWWAQFAVYPGFYYTLAALVGAVLLARWKDWKALAALLVPIGTLTLLTEALSHPLLHASHLSALRALSGTIVQGDPAYGLGFVWEYFTAGGMALFLLGLLALGATLYPPLLRQFAGEGTKAVQKTLRLLAISTLIALAVLMLHAYVSGMVLYGRVLLPFIPPLAWLAAGVYTLKERAMKHSPWLEMMMLLLFIAGPVRDMLAMRFPLDATRAFEKATGYSLPVEIPLSQHIPDLQFRVTPLAPGVTLAETRTLTIKALDLAALDCSAVTPNLVPGETVYLILNRQYVFPLTRVNPVETALLNSGEHVFRAPHPYKNPLYGFEGLTRANREELARWDVPMAVLRNPCPLRESTHEP